MATKKASNKKSYAGCLARIGEMLPDTYTASQRNEMADAILTEVDNIVQKNRDDARLQKIEDSVLSDIDLATKFIEEAKLVEKRNAVLNARARRKITNFVNQFGDQKYEGIMAYLGGSNLAIGGAKLSIDTQSRDYYQRTLGKFINQLSKNNVLDVFTSGKFDDDIARGLWAISAGAKEIPGTPETIRVAQAIAGMQRNLTQRLNRAGARIRNDPGYITRQSHDQVKIYKAGFEQWRDFITPLLDEEKTFRGRPDIDKFMRESFDNITNGQGLRQSMEDLNEEMLFLTGMTGPLNLAKKLSQNRIFHFKDADSWMAYNRAFGMRSLGEAINHGVIANSKSIALMENLGTNPELMLQRIVRDAKLASAQNTKEVERLNNGKIEWLYKTIEGSAGYSANHQLSTIASGLRVLQNMARLGGSVLSSITDIPFQMSALRNNGVSVLEGYGNAIGNILRGRGDAEARELAAYLGVGFQGMLAWHYSRFDPGDNVPGKMAKLQQKVFTLNLMNWWNDSHTAGVANILAHNLANSRHLSFNELDPKLGDRLWRYGIGKQDWDLIRAQAATQNTNIFYDAFGKYDINTALALGRGDKTPDSVLSTKADMQAFISPETARNISDREVAMAYGLTDYGNLNNRAAFEATNREIRRIKDSLEAKLGAYFHGEIYTAIPHPDARIQADLTFQTRPGTAAGEAIRFITQFKSFPVSAFRKGLAPQIQGTGSKSLVNSLFTGKSDYVGLAHFIAGTTVFGYMALTAKAAAKGQTPPDPTKPEVWAAAMMQGGGLGLYGDFIFGEFNRFGKSALATLAGPVIGQGEDIMRMYSDAKDGGLRSAQGLRLLLNNIPGANLFYLRGAMDYLMLYNLQEMASPGYLKIGRAHV